MAWLSELIETNPWLVRLGGALAVIVVAFAVAAIINRLLSRAFWTRARAASPERRADLVRVQRQQTMLTTLQGLVRYVAAGVVVVVVVVVFAENVAGALVASSMLVILVGFSLQRLLGDVISGALLLFDGHYSVGDVVFVHQYNVVGVVEDFTLRTTVLRTFAGDRVMVLNGVIVASTRYGRGVRDFRVEAIARGEVAAVRGAVERAIALAGASPLRRWLLAPSVTAIEPLAEVDDELVRVELRAVVAPGDEHLVMELLRSELRTELGEDALRGQILVVAVDDEVFQTYRSSVIVP